jgi:hypothetical protein
MLDFSRLLLEPTPSLATASPELINQNTNTYVSWGCRPVKRLCTSGDMVHRGQQAASRRPEQRIRRRGHRHHTPQLVVNSVGNVKPPQQGKSICTGRDNVRHGWGWLCRPFSCSAGLLWGNGMQAEGRVERSGPSREPWILLLARRRLVPAKEAHQQGPLKMG